MTDPAADGCIEMIIRPRERDLGEFTVRRVLPAAKRRMVGPFVFFESVPGDDEFIPLPDRHPAPTHNRRYKHAAGNC